MNHGIFLSIKFDLSSEFNTTLPNMSFLIIKRTGKERTTILSDTIIPK